MKYAVVVLNPHHLRLNYPSHLRAWKWDYTPQQCHLYDTEEEAKQSYQAFVRQGVGAVLAKVEDISDQLQSLRFSA